MKRKQRRKLIWMVAGLVVLLYLGLAVYFHNHFFPKTTLNGRKAGGYTAQKVKGCPRSQKHLFHKNHRSHKAAHGQAIC